MSKPHDCKYVRADVRAGEQLLRCVVCERVKSIGSKGKKRQPAWKKNRSKRSYDY